MPELLTSMVVLMVIGGVIVSIYQTSFRTWRTGTVQNLAQQKATWAIQRMAPDIHQGMEVVPGTAPVTSDYIAVQLPKRDFDSTLGAHLNRIQVDAEGKPELVKGGWAVYFRGDPDGTPSTTGTRIWRRLVDDDGETILRQEAVADNVVNNPDGSPTFLYWPDVVHLKSVAITITIEERIGSRVGRATMSSEIAMRNM